MVLLSFDIEEFDMPLEYKGEITFEEQILISQNGLKKILDILKKHEIKATFFSTVIFAKRSTFLINRLLDEGHELASHTWYHSRYENKHLKESREELGKLFSTKIIGIRIPRMRAVDNREVFKAGYSYNSSVNPTWLPGRYNNLQVPRTYFKDKNVLQIPASVSPFFRIPLFWLSFHNFPLWIYKGLAMLTLKNDKYLNLYFHPWEFSNIKNKSYNLPSYTKVNTGDAMARRLDNFISWVKDKNYTFVTFQEFQERIGL